VPPPSGFALFPEPNELRRLVITAGLSDADIDRLIHEARDEGTARVGEGWLPIQGWESRYRRANPTRRKIEKQPKEMQTI